MRQTPTHRTSDYLGAYCKLEPCSAQMARVLFHDKVT